VYKCVVRGKMRLADLKTTNPVAVGDKVRVQLPSEPEELGAIREVLPRKNYILRKAASHQHIVHILCANVDQAILLYTVSQPHTTSGFANRFLVVAEAYHIPVQILINKVDVLETEEEKFKLAEVTYMYESIGYPVMALSARDPRYQEQVQALLQDKVSFISGHSGAGKSTLINLVDPSLDLKTGDISTYYSKGRHTTTYAEMHALAFGGFIIDSPGIKEMGIAGFEKEELAHYFPEMRALMPDCRFSNCLHLNEPGCAVKQALETGEVHPSRYNSYLSMIEEMEEGK
jgi:ribosome biogenesis GTPase